MSVTFTFQGTQPAVGGEIDAVPLTNTFNHIITNLNSGSLGSANVDTSDIMVLGTAQTVASVKTHSSAVIMQDSVNMTFGTGSDATIDYDGTNLVIAPDVVGSGVIQVTAGIVSDTDSTDDLGTTGVRWANLYVDDITTTTSITTGGTITSGGNIVSDTDSTDDLGATGTRWANVYTDSLTSGTAVVTGGSITDTSGAISFGNENLTTTGTLSAGSTTVTALSLDDSQAVTLGTGNDATIQFDATNLVYNTAGYHSFTGGDVLVANGQGLGVGHTALVTTSITPQLQANGTGNNDGATLVSRFSADNSPARIAGLKSRDPAISDGTFASVVDNDQVLSVIGYVDDGTNFSSSVATITYRIDGTTGENDTPGSIEFSVTADGASSPTLRGKFDAAGDFFTNDGTVSSLSDDAAKKDPRPFTDGLDVIKALNPIYYEYNGMYEMGPDDGREHIGFSANAVAKVSENYTRKKMMPVYGPEVDGERPVIRKDELLVLNQINMIPALVNAVKELSKQVEDLKA